MDEGMGLTETEARCLALRIAARQIRGFTLWLEWEDYPNLGEHAFERVIEAMHTVAKDLEKQTRQVDRIHDVDSADLIEKATT